MSSEGSLKNVCPVCALHLMSIVHNKRLLGFEGTIANQMLDEARRHYKETEQKHPYDL